MLADKGEARTDPWCPPLSVSLDQGRVFATKLDGEPPLTYGCLSEDRSLGHLRKASALCGQLTLRRRAWWHGSIASHQALDQISIAEKLAKFAGGLLESQQADSPERAQALADLDVLRSTMAAAGRVGTSWGAHLDQRRTGISDRGSKYPDPCARSSGRTVPDFCTSWTGFLLDAWVVQVVTNGLRFNWHRLPRLT